MLKQFTFLLLFLVACSTTQPATQQSTAQQTTNNPEISSSSTASQTATATTVTGTINCDKLLMPEEVSNTCSTGPLTREPSSADGKYYNLCGRNYMSGKAKKFTIEIINANQEAFDGGYRQRVGTPDSPASSISQGKAIDGLGDKAYQFKDGSRNRIEFRQGTKNIGVYGEAKSCSFEQVLALATLVSSRLPE